ncbi:sushi domain-containing protein 2-like isoform X1 [Ostrea edulis]|uniref:sushi domain-containing protein 2-like isoform X1 n=1 Tax=Ostrea edulis TaxID=37623 RepID=UPI0024AF5F4D|nr:sushi domain-containing protein 2-like isoform X1 [Ostrea edulis]
MKLIIFALIFCFLPHSFCINQFYPHGHSNGDTTVDKNDDGSSTEIPISTLFPFFDHQHDHLIVNTNGVISFLGTLSTYTPNSFPLAHDRRLVAIFWADVDTRKGGTVWYRESTNQTILHRATEEVRTYFPQFNRFQATWVFIATWDNVAFFGCSSCTKRNTFQEILITNGQHSFTVFNYGQIKWTTGTASGGNAETGLGGTPAQVGFNAGDGRVFYVVNASRTHDIIGVNHMSNIGIPGKFAFRIDAAEIDNGGCNTWGTLTISPRYGPMLGGQYLVIGGPCMNPDVIIQIQYSSIVTSFPCRRDSDFSAVCITPMFNLTGDITITLTIKEVNGNTRDHTGHYTIVNPAITNNPVRRHEPEKWINGQQYGISWDPQAFELRGSERIHIHLYTLKEHTNKQLIWEKSVLHDNIEKSLRTFTITLHSDGYMAVLRVTSALQTDLDMPTRGIWSDIFAIVPSQEQSKQFCSSWLRNEARLPRLSSGDISPCPCTLQQALVDTARYQPDPDCNRITNTRIQDLNCLYRADAQHCVRLSAPGRLGIDNVCCYDKDGNLIDSRVKKGGTLQRYHYLGGVGNVPYVTNFYYDVLPSLHCCRYFDTRLNGFSGMSVFSECQDYLEFRDVSSCVNYIPPQPAGAHGDPHIKTLDGKSYDFNGLGEFQFMISKTASFESQIRFEQVTDSTGNNVYASVCTSFVSQVTHSTDKVEVRLNSIRMADVLVNGIIQDFSDVSWLRYRGVSVLSLPNLSGTSTGRDIIVMFDTLGVSFRILASQKMLNVITVIGNNILKGTLSGLVGNFDGDPANDLRLPSDATEEAIFHVINESWRITNRNSLFTYPNGKTYSDYNSERQVDFRPVFSSSVTSPVTTEARELCGSNTDCLFDLHVTGSRDIAQSTRQFTYQLQQAADAARPVQSCPVLPSKDGGVWYTNNTLENATANFLCGMGYRISGSCPPTTCKNGTWSNFRHCSCIKILTSPPTSTRRTTFTSIPQSRTPPSLTPAPTSQSTRFPMSIGHQMTSIATRISTLEPSSAGQTAVSSTPQSQEHQPRTPPPTSQSTRTVAYVAHQTTPVPTKDNYNFLKFISNKAHVWFINGVGVVFIIFIILIGSFVTCKIRSREKYVGNDSENPHSSGRSSRYQKYNRGSQMNSGRTHTDASAELSEVSEGSKQSLPGCDNYGYSESGP